MGRKKAIPILSPGVDEKLDIQRGFMPGSATISAGWGVNVSAEQPEDFTAPGWTDPLVWLTPLEKSAEGAKSRPRRKTGRKVNIVHDGTDGDESYREETLTEGDDTAHAGDDDDDSYHDETEPNEDNTKIPSRLASRGRVVLKYRATEDRNVAAPSRGTNRGQASGSSALGQGDKTLGRVANLCDVAPENIIPGEGGTSGRRKSKRISKPLHFMQERNVDNDDKDSDDDEESMLPPIEDSRSRRSSIHEGLPDSLSADENEGTADDDDAPETEDENSFNNRAATRRSTRLVHPQTQSSDASQAVVPSSSPARRLIVVLSPATAVPAGPKAAVPSSLPVSSPVTPASAGSPSSRPPRRPTVASSPATAAPAGSPSSRPPRRLAVASSPATAAPAGPKAAVPSSLPVSSPVTPASAGSPSSRPPRRPTVASSPATAAPAGPKAAVPSSLPVSSPATPPSAGSPSSRPPRRLAVASSPATPASAGSPSSRPPRRPTVGSSPATPASAGSPSSRTARRLTSVSSVPQIAWGKDFDYKLCMWVMAESSPNLASWKRRADVWNEIFRGEYVFQNKSVQLTAVNPVPSARLKSQFSERTQQAGEAGVDEWKDIMAIARSDIRYTTMLQRINDAVTRLDSTNGWTP